VDPEYQDKNKADSSGDSSFSESTDLSLPFEISGLYYINETGMKNGFKE